MARAYQQSQPLDHDRERSPAEWQSLRSELVALLDQVDGQVARKRTESPLTERVRDLRHQLAEADQQAATRHRDALRTVQRQIHRFEEAPAQMPPNPRDSLQAAIDQIRIRQGEIRNPAPVAAQAPMVPRVPSDAPVLEKLAKSVNGLSGRLERIEAEIKAQVKTGANVKDVADQVAQLAHVVELLAGAVGETGQVKRLEGQIASLGKIMAQGRETDGVTLTRRLDDIAATVGRLAELQVHFADRVQPPTMDLEVVRDGMHSIEEGVRNVYDRIDALERSHAMPPVELEHLTAEMARFTESMRDSAQPRHLVELVDALNGRISEIETGDQMVRALREDLGSLREAVLDSLAPRFDALERRLDSLSSEVGTRADMAEIGRQIGMLGDRIEDRSADPSLGALEAQVRQLVARMDQTGEQLSGLTRLYSEASPQASEMDFDAVADMVATRTAAAMSKVPADSRISDSITDTLNGLESRITAMLANLRSDDEVADFSDMQAGIGEVNVRLRRLEESLLSGRTLAPAPVADAVQQSDIEALIAEVDAATMRPRDAMPRSPQENIPLNAPPFPDPVDLAPVPSLKSEQPDFAEDVPLAARHDTAPRFEPLAVETPPAPMPSAGFASAPEPVAETTSGNVPVSSRNTFIEAARRAAQRQKASQAVSSGSLIGKALARLHTTDKPAEAVAAPKVGKARPEKAPRVLAGDKPARDTFKVEPAVDVAAPAIATEHGPQQPSIEKESFLLRNRKTILLAAAVVALAFLTLNLVAQRMVADHGTAPAASLVTGDVDTDALPIDETADAEVAARADAPRVIPMVDSMATGAITTAAQGFSTAPLPVMPSAFGAATELAAASPAAIAPLVPETAPVMLELPPEGVGPIGLREAAARGDVRAQFEVAAILTEGRAVPQDYQLAAVWYERAAAAGFAPAQYRLGSLYENGTGVEKNLDTARLWYERAAEAGNRMSMHNLAALYAGGQLGKQQFEAAAKWFEEAANRGMTDSQFNLGMLYARGLGVPQSLEDSFKWFGIAALSGDKGAAKARDDMARSLDADAMTRLMDVVNNFRPAPIDLAANFAPIGAWSEQFDPGETIAAREIVSSVQRALDKLGFDVGRPDGVAGSKTEAAIRSFEQATGMNQVGRINPRLLAVLGSQPV